MTQQLFEALDAAMALTVRVLVTAFPAVTIEWQQIVVFVAIASMVLGAFAAIGQTNIKRLLAYSSINNVGFALVGLAAGTQQGASSVLFYMAVYVVMTLGAFLCVLRMRDQDGEPVETLESLSGLSQTRPRRKRAWRARRRSSVARRSRSSSASSTPVKPAPTTAMAGAATVRAIPKSTTALTPLEPDAGRTCATSMARFHSASSNSWP